MSARRPDDAGRTEEPLRQRLMLTVPAEVPPAHLREALGAGDVAAVILCASAKDGADLVAAAQEAGAAALVTGASAWPAPHGADGLHLDPHTLDRLAKRPKEAVCGAAAHDRHGAMLAGEAGADYVLFDGAGNTLDAAALAAWWQEVFEVPAVVSGPREFLTAMVESGAEFVAMVDAFSDGDAAERVAQAHAALGLVKADGR